jgi:hypothetical protein
LRQAPTDGRQIDDNPVGICQQKNLIRYGFADIEDETGRTVDLPDPDIGYDRHRFGESLGRLHQGKNKPAKSHEQGNPGRFQKSLRPHDSITGCKTL